MGQSIGEQLAFLYGAEAAPALAAKLESVLNRFQMEHPELATGEGTDSRFDKLKTSRFSEKDAILITYGDMVQTPDAPPLAALGDFLKQWLGDVVSTVHLLPFFPYSSDDGFSVIDYRAVNPALGGWGDVDQIGQHFRLMFDVVANHISAQSEWFQAFLRDEAPYRDYFTVIEGDPDLTAVFRPRSLPLLTAVSTPSGTKKVWTTFSADQIDLNYANPDLLFEILDILLLYIAHGAAFIRLDAIAFIWKEIGTDCLHRPQTHAIIKLMRTALNIAAPQVSIISETNVPHKDNVSYFGNGRDEAQMVYNFSLPPLTLHAFHTGNAETLSRWAKTLTLPSDEVTFFNFLASHDGIGLTPTDGILDKTAVNQMAARVEALGGYVSYKSNGDGSKNAYELNINYLDALGNPDNPDEPIKTVADRFLAAQAIMLALRGVPGIYFHSLFGSKGWREGAEENGRSRTINREKLPLTDLEAELSDKQSLRYAIYSGYANLLRNRAQQPAFHPNSDQEILDIHDAVFAVRRTAVNDGSSILCLQNVSSQPVTVTLSATQPLRNILDGRVYAGENGRLRLELRPYGVCWLAV